VTLGVRSFQVSVVDPLTLKWARETCGKSVAEVSRKLAVVNTTVTDWETGASAPTLGQLQDLTTIYKRCLAALLLPAPPIESPPPTEYRTLPELQRDPLGEDVYLAIRRARAIQSSFKELVPSLGDFGVSRLPAAELTDHPEGLAERMIEYLGLTSPRGSSYQVLKDRVGIVEAAGVLVLQLGMPVEQSRAFSLADAAAPVIVLNSHDGPSPRSFSLFHEFAHLLLRRSGTCGKMRSFIATGSTERAVEAFCNQFAASLLVPPHEIAGDELVRAHGPSPEWSDSELSRLATRFGVSRQVILRRLLSLHLTTHAFFTAKQGVLEQQAAHVKKRQGGGADPAGRAIRENGLSFTRLVLDAYHQEIVGPTGAAALLGVKYKHFSNLEAIAAGAGS
jgi:Zn-dependent peptidase ImmA (M78 family)/transcriptional regulator with XRE-family HTH domain